MNATMITGRKKLNVTIVIYWSEIMSLLFTLQPCFYEYNALSKVKKDVLEHGYAPTYENVEISEISWFVMGELHRL